MSYPREHRWFHRMAFGLAFASVMFAGRASVAPAKIDPGTHGSGRVTAGGWSGMVDLESGIPLSAGIPLGDEEFLDDQRSVSERRQRPARRVARRTGRRTGRAAPRTRVQGHERQGRHAGGHRADAADLDGPGLTDVAAAAAPGSEESGLARARSSRQAGSELAALPENLAGPAVLELAGSQRAGARGSGPPPRQLAVV